MRTTIRYMSAVTALAILMLLSATSALAGGAGTYGWSLRGENNSGVSGQATASDNGDGTTTILIELQGQINGICLCASLHDGKRDDYKSDPTFVLNDVVDGKSTTVIPMSLLELRSESRVLLIQDPSGIVAFGALTSI